MGPLSLFLLRRRRVRVLRLLSPSFKGPGSEPLRSNDTTLRDASHATCGPQAQASWPFQENGLPQSWFCFHKASA